MLAEKTTLITAKYAENNLYNYRIIEVMIRIIIIP